MMDSTWRRGPVAITGADGQVGRALQRQLARLPNEVRPLGRSADLASAFHDAAAVVHLAGTLQPLRPNTYRAANLDTVSRTAEALADSQVERIVFLSFLTADPASSNDYLRFKGQAEQVLRDLGRPVVIFRCGHIYGPPEEPGPTAQSMLARNGTARVLGPGSQRRAPLFRDDVAAAVVHAALDPSTPTGTFELAGPQTMSLDELVRGLHHDGVTIRHLPSWLARWLPFFVPALPRPLVEILLADAVAADDPAATADAFGVRLRRLDETWRKTHDE